MAGQRIGARVDVAELPAISRRWPVVIAVAGLALAVWWLALAGGARAASPAVSIAGFAFQPAKLGVVVGDTVTWTNNDGTGHSATADGGAFDTGVLAGGSSGSFTFATAGTFTYHCKIHRNMTGTVTVLDAVAVTTPAPTTPATDTEAAATGATPGAALPTGPWVAAVMTAAVMVVLAGLRARSRR
jgi:plastocyanin